MTNIYTLNKGEPKYIKQLPILKGKTNSNTIIVGNYNNPLTSMDRSSKQKVNKKTQALNGTLDKMDSIHLLEHSTQRQQKTVPLKYTWNFLKDTLYTRTKTCLNKFNKMIILNLFLIHNGMKLEISHKKKTREITSMWGLNNMLLKNY